MDVPYSKSGASSRAHYQIVRNVENAPHQSEQLVCQEVARIQQRIAGKMLSTNELRKDLIVLLYCLNTSFGSVNGKTLAFALPSAVHLAEAGSKLSEKRIGYLFCWEAMPREHELQLMLVNTIRKDLTSTSVANIGLALEAIINLPSADIVPAVQMRCVELLSHPSARIRALSMNALHSLAQFSFELLNDDSIKQLVLKRVSDGDESVVRTALKLGVSLVESNLLEGGKLLRSSISLVTRSLDKHSATKHSSALIMGVLSTISRLYDREESTVKTDYASELLPAVLSISRRAVKNDNKSLILESFRLLGRFPSTSVAQYITKISSALIESPRQGEGSDKGRPLFTHPVARIRYYLSSRTVNDHYLFFSCLVCLDPSLWAGTPQPSMNLLSPDAGESRVDQDAEKSGIPLVLDQLEVERMLSFLDSEDGQIRSLTLRILVSLDPSLVETCYTRALDALRALDSSGTANDQARRVTLQRLVELAFTIVLSNKILQEENRAHALVERIKEIIDASGTYEKVNRTVVESVLTRVKEEEAEMQRACTRTLLSLLQDSDNRQQPNASPFNATLFLILMALACELASIFAASSSEIVSTICLFATMLHSSPPSMQEPLLLCMTRFVAFLPRSELSSLEIEDVRRVVHDLGEASATDNKKVLLLKRCEQFEEALKLPDGIVQLLGNKQNVSLPEFALLLDKAGHQLPSPVRLATPASPNTHQTGSHPLSQSKLRYDAYAPPPTNFSSRLLRAHSHSSAASGRSSNRASSRASSTRPEEGDADVDLSKTVTAGELTLAAASRHENLKMYRSAKGKMPEVERAMTNVALNDAQARDHSSMLTLDSPFLPEPLVDVDVAGAAPPSGTPPVSSPYVSASTSLRTSPEPGASFEVLWSELDAFSARGWCEDAVDVVVLRLQGLGLRMDVLDADLQPFEGDLKISLTSASLESLDSRVPCAVFRLHEEGDGSCVWQIKSSDRGLGLKVKELMR